MINIIWTYLEEERRVVSTDLANEAKKVIERYRGGGISIEDTPIFICSRVEEINQIQGLYQELNLPNDKKPVILLLKDQELSQENRGGFTSFKTNEEYEEGKVYTDEVDKILGVVTKAREIGITHGQTFEKGFLGSGSETSFKFSEDDPKKYFEAFMEFVAYGGQESDKVHQNAIKEYWEKLLVKFEIIIDLDSLEYDTSGIKTKFGISDNEYSKIFSNDGSFEYDELKKHSEQKLQEKKITEEKSIYSGKHEFVGKIIGGRLYIKSSGSFNGGLFKEGNGVATIFGDFNVEGIDKITADNIGGIAAQDPRLATAVTAAVRQLQRFKNISDLNNENGVFGDGSLFLRERDISRTQGGELLEPGLAPRGDGDGGRPPHTTIDHFTISQPGREGTSSTIST